MQPLSGNLTGLKPSQQRLLERIYRRRIPAKEVISEELATFMCQCSAEIKRQVLDDVERRRAYFHRFVFSQQFAQVDPWSERVSGKDKHEFQPMASIPYATAAE